jgi:hypothetical protein
MRGAANKKDFTVRDGHGRLAEPEELVVPIFLANDRGMLSLRGTGFFVTRQGWFVTAKHVFLGPEGRPLDGFYAMQIAGTTFYPRPVTHCVLHHAADIAIGICAQMTHKVTGEPLLNRIPTLSTRPLYLHEHVWTYAYPGTTVMHDSGNHVQLHADFYLGNVTGYAPSGGPERGARYQTSIALHGAASGGPVFAAPGHIVGVNSSGLDFGSNEGPDVSFVCRIVDALDMGVPNVLMPGEKEPQVVTIRQLAALKHAAIR